MMRPAGFGYAQARLQGRLAGLPSEEEWSRLAASRTLASFLEEARTGAVRDWIRSFSAQSRPHDFEQGLRALVWELVREAAGWCPLSWRPAVQWIAWVPLLPLIEHLARGQVPPGWMGEDPGAGVLLDERGALDAEKLEQSGLQPLLAVSDAGQTGAVWFRLWRERWPPMGRLSHDRLVAVAALIQDHLTAFRQAEPEQAWDLRGALRARLRLCLHRHPLQPAAVFLYLAMLFLDLERLRGELLARALFADEAG